MRRLTAYWHRYGDVALLLFLIAAVTALLVFYYFWSGAANIPVVGAAREWISSSLSGGLTYSEKVYILSGIMLISSLVVGVAFFRDQQT